MNPEIEAALRALDGAPAARRALEAAAKGRWERAEEILSRAAARGRRAWPWTLLAVVRRGRGDWSGARRALESALALEPSAELHAELARAHETLGLWTRALESAARAVRLAPTVENLALKARLHRRWREYGAAARDYARALKRPGAPASLRLELSQTLAAMGRRKDALREARAAGPEANASSWRGLLEILAGAKAPREGFLAGYAALRARRWAAAERLFGRAAAGAGNPNDAARADFYRAVASALRSEPPRRARGPRLHLAGMGIEPPYTATAACLRAIASSDVVFSNVPGPEIDELLMVLCRDNRPLAYHQENDEGRLAALMMKELRSGKIVSFVTRGSALVYGPLGAELVRRCRAAGLPWSCVPAVSSAEVLEARFGAGAPPAGTLVLDDRALKAGARVDPKLPLTLYLTVERSPENFRALCRRLAGIYGRGRRCLVLDRQVGQEPLRVTIAGLPALWDKLTAAALLHIPARSACEPPAGAPARLLFFGLGLLSSRDATLETIQRMRSCDRLYAQGAAPRGARRADARAIARDLARGLTIGLATPSHPFSWSPLAAKLVALCRRRGLGWTAFPSVSPAGVALADAGLSLGTEGLALQSFPRGAVARPEPSWPLVVHATDATPSPCYRLSLPPL